MHSFAKLPPKTCPSGYFLLYSPASKIDIKASKSAVVDKLTILVQLANSGEFDFIHGRLSEDKEKLLLTRPVLEPAILTHGHRLTPSITARIGEDTVRDSAYSVMISDFGSGASNAGANVVQIPRTNPSITLPMTELSLLIPHPYLGENTYFNGTGVQGTNKLKKHLVRFVGGAVTPADMVLAVGQPFEGNNTPIAEIMAAKDPDSANGRVAKLATGAMMGAVLDTPCCFFACFEMSVPSSARGFEGQTVENLADKFNDLDFS